MTDNSQTLLRVPLGPPQRHHHLAYVTYDAGKTADFYTRIMRMPLIAAVMDDKIPSTGEECTYLHLFFSLGDGSALAFFEAAGIPELPLFSDHPVHKAFNHVALQVDTGAEIENWHNWLIQNGVSVIRTDHGIIESLYFSDPNGVRLEITRNVDENWTNKIQNGEAALKRWCETKAEAVRKGEDPVKALQELAASASHARNMAAAH
ncbi:MULTISPECIES: VOC family protein [unclassified Bradyrhizobium]|uniref:VOC family protein n=1 Tax=unclassified Bradyrhizobium TaxID=2631580 RepID=UPI00339B546C